MALPNFIRRLLRRERRQNERSGRQSLRLEFRGLQVRTVDWSLGGCLLAALDPPLEPRVRVGDTFEGRISGIGLGNSGDFVAEVVRLTKDGEIGLRWLELDSHVFLVLSGLNAKK
ncbi:MAG: PilZ domain-containing protein [Alphaproteobacteria bacterium]|nr:PilZ domain-containing protein [Alphaproteobacteria bacterium]